MGFAAVTALWGACWVRVAAAGQAAAFLQVELRGGWADCAVERTRSFALGTRAVTLLTLGLILLQTQNTSKAPFIWDFVDLSWRFCPVLHSLGGHLCGTAGVNVKIP